MRPDTPTTGLRLLRSPRRSSALWSPDGLRAAYAAHGGELYGFARRALDDEGQAQDAVQETFLRAWRAGDRFDPQIASPRAWLFSICRNVIIDTARARAARPLIGPPSDDLAVDDNIDEHLRGWQVEEALRRISHDHRYAITETYYRARPAAHIAAELGVPVGTVRTRLFYGLKALRLTLEEMGWDDQ